jgi:hypothetical protein
MDEFLRYFTCGFRHVLDFRDPDHFLFIIILIVPYTPKHWRTIVLLLTLFTLGNTMALIMAFYINIKADIAITEIMMECLILFAAIYNFIKARQSPQDEKIPVVGGGTLLFGIMHGLGLYSQLRPELKSTAREKLFPLLEFSLGLEVGHILLTGAVLLLAFALHRFFNVSKRDWIFITSSFVAGVALPMMFDNKF